jgi:hypothetical protein
MNLLDDSRSAAIAMLQNQTRSGKLLAASAYWPAC